MNYLDQTGLGYLWSKIKTYVGTVVEGEVGEIVVNWDDIRGKPSTFTPSTHTHTVSQITDFPTNIVTNVTISGSGNAVTNASFSDNTLTITKGTIGGSDGNNYPTAIGLTYSNGTLEASVDRNGMGSISDNIAINWDTLYGKPSWIDNGPYLPLSGGKLTGDLTIGDVSEELKVGVIECGTGIRIYDMYSTDEFDGSSYGLQINNEGIWKSGNVDNEVFFTDGTTGTVVRSVAINGTGNAIVNATFENARLNLTKGTISAGASGITQSEADGRYVNVSGDTMTGDLNVTGHTVNAQTVDVTNVEALQINISGNTNNNAINVNNGGVTAKAFYESSDISLKENIAPITKEATNAVDCLAFKQFNFKDDKDKITKYGVIAQEVEAVGLPNLVSTNEEGVKSVDYISLLILKIEALEKRIAKLEAERG